MDVKGVRTTTLYWETIPQLIVGEPPVATVSVRNQLFAYMKRYLETPTSHITEPTEPARCPS